MNRISITPGRKISAGSIPVLIFFLIFGIGFAVLVGNVLAENDAPPLLSLLFFIIILLWISTVIFLLVYHIKNLKNPNSDLSLLNIHTESAADSDVTRNPAQLLRDLELLKKDGLITEAEYLRKRTNILNERW